MHFYHERTGRVTWEHPADKHYRKLEKATLVGKYGGGVAQAVHSAPTTKATHDSVVG